MTTSSKKTCYTCDFCHIDNDMYTYYCSKNEQCYSFSDIKTENFCESYEEQEV